MGQDRELIEAIVREPRNFSVLLKKYDRLVWNIINGMVDERAAAEDIYQDVFLKVYRNLDTFNFRSRLSTWIGRIAYNATYDVLSDQKRKTTRYRNFSEIEGDAQLRIVDDGTEPLEALIQKENREHMRQAVTSLTGPYRLVIELYHFQEFSYEEISEILDMPMGTVKNYLYRARQKLKEKL